jgi:hypothetical protein
MATYFLRTKHISRGKGARATRAAAYRAGERIRDERTSEVYDCSDRRDVAYKEVVLPADLAARPDMAWTQDRSVLWNAAEHAGLRRNSRLARELLVLLPPELTAAQRTDLVRAFAGELADKYRCAVDVCLHQPRPGADARNHHAHLLMTTPDGFGRRTDLEHNGQERRRVGLSGSSLDEYLRIRERWAEVTNESLRRAGLAASVDHRSLERQGIDREPVPSIPEKVFYAERKRGVPSAAGDAIRARHRERVEARRIPGERARVVDRQKAELRDRASKDIRKREAQPKRIPWGALSREERNAHRRARYEERRIVERKDPVREAQRRESSRLAERARRQANPEAVREEKRRWRKANADEVNRKQREYRAARRAAAVSPPSRATAAQSAKNWNAYRHHHGSAPTAEESARAWRELGRTAPDSPSAAASHSARPVPDRTADSAPAAGPSRITGPDHDFGP